MNNQRLYVFTGKGGVGKSTLAVSFAQYLKDQGQKVEYIYFEKNGLEELLNDFQIKYQLMDLFESAEGYVSKKLNSRIIGNFVVKTKFFRALLQMIPGFSYLIYLGHILEKIKNDPELIVVVDSPSSGHALTMFESPKNFREIFKSGLLVEDINKMTQLIDEDGILKVIICAFPTSMAIQEAKELEQELKSLEIKNTNIFINNSFSSLLENNQDELPEFLKKKLNLEKEVLNNYSSVILGNIPHSSNTDLEKRVNEISKQSGVFV